MKHLLYFVHSYYFDNKPEYVLGQVNYGQGFAAVVAKDNFWVTQLHLKKSGSCGLQLLTNFSSLQ